MSATNTQNNNAKKAVEPKVKLANAPRKAKKAAHFKKPASTVPVNPALNMNKAFFLRNEDHVPRWRIVDAQGKIVGRLATEIADVLRGKDRAHYTPHADSGDYVVVINSDKVVFTGKKMKQKIYQRYTGYIGNMVELTAEQVMQKDSTRIIMEAVKRMLPKSTLAAALLRKLRVYTGAEHPHAAQLAGFAEESVK